MTTPPLDLPALRAKLRITKVTDNAEVLALLDRVEAGEDWTTVYPCKLTRDEPFDFGQCETHDRTFPLGGTCDHAGKSEIDWMSDRESEQRVRAMRAEDRAEAAEAKVERVETLASDGAFVAIDVYGDLSAKQCGDGEDLLAVTLPDLRAALNDPR